MRLPIPYARRFMHPAAILTAVMLCGLSFSNASAQTIPPPKVPDAIQAPANEHVVLHAHATGSQIYTCQATTEGKFSWTLKAPDAELKDEKGKVIGSHFAGPSWKLTDGSKITGKAVAHVDSPDPDSISWLLVHVIGGSGNGLLLNVTTVQRVNTHNGKPPAEGCDASHVNAESKSAYTADYYFYAPKPAANRMQSLNLGETILRKNSILFKNSEYGFTFELPKSWAGFSVALDEWHNAMNPDKEEHGPEFAFEYPPVKPEDAPQDLVFMVFTHSQWALVDRGELVVSAAPFGPGELARNRKYVFAYPPRDLNPDAPGFEEALNIWKSHPLRAL